MNREMLTCAFSLLLAVSLAAVFFALAYTMVTAPEMVFGTEHRTITIESKGK